MSDTGGEMAAQRGSIERGTASGTAADAAAALASFFAIPYLVARLGVADFGVLALLALVGGQLGFLQQALAVAVTRRIAEAHGRGEGDRIAAGVRAAWIAALLLALTAAAAVLGVGTALWSHLDATARFSPPALLPAAALTLATQPLFYVAQALFFADERFDAAAASRALFQLTRIAVAVAAVASGGALPTVLYAQAAVDAATALLLYTVTTRRHDTAGAHLELAAWARSILSLAIPLGGANVAQAVLLNGDKYLVSALLGSAALTYYTVPYTVGFRMLMVAPALDSALQPRLARLAVAGDLEGARALAQRWTRLTIAPAAALVSALIALAPEALAWWIGTDFAARAGAPARALAIGLFATAVATPANAVARAQLDPRLLRRFYALQIPAYGVLALALIRTWGITGAALAWSARAVLDAAFVLHLAGRAVNAPLLAASARVVPLLAVTALAALCAGMGGALSASARTALATGGALGIALLTLRGEDLRLLVRRALLEGHEL